MSNPIDKISFEEMRNGKVDIINDTLDELNAKGFHGFVIPIPS
jgi:hypothetical protein